MTGTIAELQRDRGVGTLLGEDGRRYSFRRSSVRDCWFHELSEGARVTFEPGSGSRAFEASSVRLVRDSN